MSDRLPAGLEVAALLRQVSSAGGFATVLAKGSAEAGTLGVVMVDNGRKSRADERLPAPDGSRVWHCAKREDAAEPHIFAEYLRRRQEQDSDLWIIELDIAQAERFIGLPPAAG